MSCHRYPTIILLLLTVSLAAFIVPVAHAQTPTCPATVEQALATAGQNCDALDRNLACYGAPILEADLAETYTPDQFDTVSDRVDVNGVRQIRSQAPAPQQEIAGTAVIKLQAMLPNTLPGQGVIMVIVGNTSLSNDTIAGQTTTPAEPVPATTTANANLRSAPLTAAAVMDGTAAGETLQVDGIDASNQWLRVIRDERTLWISRTVVQPNPAFDELPVLTEGFAPMQAFSISGGIGSADCVEAPDAILIQNPNQNETRLSINGSSVTIGSSIVVEYDSDNTQLRLTVLDGGARLGNLPIPAGYTALANLDSDETVIQWNTVMQIDDDLRERYAFVEQVPDNLLNYPVRIPSDDEIVEFESTTPPTATPNNPAPTTPPAGTTDSGDNNDGTTDSGSTSGGTTDSGASDSGDSDSNNGDNDDDDDDDDDDGEED